MEMFEVRLKEETVENLDYLMDNDTRFKDCKTYCDAIAKLIEMYGGKQ